MTQKVSGIDEVRGKRIAFVGAGYPGKRFIYEKAHELGALITIIDSSESWSKSLVSEGIINSFVAVDFGQAHFDVIERIVAGLVSQKVVLDGVCTFAEMSLPIAAKLAQRLGLPGSSPEAVELARDKHRLRELIASIDANEVRSYSIKSECDLEAAGTYVGFPAVLKPVSGADSLGVKKVESACELREAFFEVSNTVSSLIVSSGSLSRKSSPVFLGDDQQANRFIKLDLSLEEYLEGPEVDVDVVLFEKKCYFAAVMDNGPTQEPYFAETWNLNPSLLSPLKQEALIDQALRTLLQMGFSDGVFHVEQKYTCKGPRIIEVNARMGGGPIRLLHKVLYGVDLVVEQILSCLGLPPSRAVRGLVVESGGMCVASATPNAPRSGVLRSAGFLDDLMKSKNPNVIGVWKFVDENSSVVGPEQGQPSWLCEIALKGSSGSAALLEQLTSITDSLVSDVDSNYYL